MKNEGKKNKEYSFMNIMVNAYVDNNLGDDLMIKLLAKRFPDYNFYLYSNLSIVKNTFENIKNVFIRPISDRKSDINMVDAYITIGGSVFQIHTMRHMISRIIKIYNLKKIKKKRIKIATIGANFGPYSSKIGIKLIEWELRVSDLITVRDEYSEKLLKTFKNIKNYHLADDIVFNMDSICSDKKDGLGISVYRSIKGNETNFENYKAISQIADKYIIKTGKKVRLFAFDSENENDVVAAHYILNFAEEKDKIEIIPYIGDETLFLSEFKKSERMIAIRFHSAILADSFKIPFLPIVYSNKMKNLISDRGFDGKMIMLEDLNMELDFETIVNDIVSGKGLFYNFLDNKGNSNMHFDELEMLLKKIDK